VGAAGASNRVGCGWGGKKSNHMVAVGVKNHGFSRAKGPWGGVVFGQRSKGGYFQHIGKVAVLTLKRSAGDVKKRGEGEIFFEQN